MLRENLKDAADILSNILSQPLKISGTSESVSLLGALMSFDPAHPQGSELSKILKEFVKYPGPVQTLIQELELLSNDLTVE